MLSTHFKTVCNLEDGNDDEVDRINVDDDYGNKFERKTLQDHKALPRVHLIGCRGVNLILPKDCIMFCQSLNCQNFSFF